MTYVSLQKLHVTGTKDKKEVKNVYIMSSSCEILENSVVKAMKKQYKEWDNGESNVLMSILSSFVLQHASLSCTFTANSIEKCLTWNILTTPMSHMPWNFVSYRQFYEWIFTFYFTDYMKLYDFEGVFNVEISHVQCQQLVVVESSSYPTVCFIPSYLNQHSISFKTLLEFGKNLKITSKITLNIAWPMTIYFLHLYTIDINKYTYSRDTYHMLFHMIDSVNLRSFKIIIMFKWDKSLVPNEISITRGICIHNLNMIKI